MEPKKNKLFHILNLLIAVAFAMACFFPACIMQMPLLIVILFSYANLPAVKSNFLFSLRTVCKIE